MPWGIALSGGGLLGAAHLGALEALQGAGLWPEIMAGTSAGGLVAGVLAAGTPLSDLVAYGQKVSSRPQDSFSPNVLRLAFELLPHDPLPPPTGLVNPKKFIDGLVALLPGNPAYVEDLKLACALTAVDLSSQTATLFSSRPLSRKPRGTWQKTFHTPLATALHATMAMPGVFQAARNGEHLYVDGGVADTLPSDLAYALGADKVIAIDVAPVGPLPKRVGIEEVLSRSEAYAVDTLSRLRLPPAAKVLTLRPDTHGVPFLGFSQYGHLVRSGARCVQQNRAAIEAFLSEDSVQKG